ncbi:MAG: hypothetical protein AAF329_06235 [Cyanobacteria bacterium P01_A01_bin.17]
MNTSQQSAMEASIFDTLFRDSQGEIVIAQPPNATLSVWIGASLLKLAVTEGPGHAALETVAFSAIIIWSIQELYDGVNYFRRGLGLLVLVSVLASKVDQALLA